ncbi:hypothetical protein DFS33DRAFT_1235807, partial [Desarmillaria ectypa]
MIVIAHPLKLFTFTVKGTPQRPAILKAYRKEIEAVYEAVNMICISDILAPQKWSLDNIPEWIRCIVQSLLCADAQISDIQDMF